MNEKKIDRFFKSEKIKLGSEFTQETLRMAKVEELLSSNKLTLGVDFADKVLASAKGEKHIISYKYMAYIVSTLAALLFVGLFINTGMHSDTLPKESDIMFAIQENLATELQYANQQAKISKLSDEIDMLNVSILETNANLFSSLK